MWSVADILFFKIMFSFVAVYVKHLFQTTLLCSFYASLNNNVQHQFLQVKGGGKSFLCCTVKDYRDEKCLGIKL